MHDPELYESYSQFQRRDAMELVPYIVSKMTSKKIETVLDFGCGTGFITKNIILPSLMKIGMTNKTKLYGFDVAKKMVEYASVKNAHPNVTYMVADVMKEDCEFPCKFDKIFSLHVLHWISDHEKALRRLRDLLNPNGEIGFYFLSKSVVYSVYDTMSKCSTWKEYFTDVKNFIPKSYYSKDPAHDIAELMTTIGYDVHETSNCARKFRFDKFDDMIAAAIAANPFISRVPACLQDEFRKDFKLCFLPFVQHVGNANNPTAIEVDYTIVLVRASRQEPTLKAP